MRFAVNDETRDRSRGFRMWLINSHELCCPAHYSSHSGVGMAAHASGPPITPPVLLGVPFGLPVGQPAQVVNAASQFVFTQSMHVQPLAPVAPEPEQEAAQFAVPQPATVV
ncbi:MAG: hypothetical protein JRJ24_13985 [Deltaproteobacteria bacterium]|nr:hypothetical protein [Deltaproteobacteria bacterium]